MPTKILKITSGVYITLAIGVVISIFFGQFKDVDLLLHISQILRTKQYEWALLISYLASTIFFSIDVLLSNSMSMSRKTRWLLLIVLMNLMVHRTYIKHFRNM